jgi:uncharacterized protein (TIGR04255 family)
VPLRRLVPHRENFGPRAPIQEALIDVQILGEDPGLESLKAFGALVGERFPKVQTQSEWQGEFQLSASMPAPTVKAEQRVRGFVYFGGANASNHVVQARRDGFTFSLLNPYTSWEEFAAEAKDLWARYVEVAKPRRVARLALRYINRLNFPPGEMELTDWFHLRPVAPSVLGRIESLLVRLSIAHPDDEGYRALITLGSDEPKDGKASFLFDIDTAVNQELAVDDSIWEILSNLHEFKNDIFFGSLTDRTYERIRSE